MFENGVPDVLDAALSIPIEICEVIGIRADSKGVRNAG